MAKIDLTKIVGYEAMSEAEKIKALEEYNFAEPDYSGYVKKEVFDKTASELATKKKELRDKLSEDEKKAQEDKEAFEELQTSYATLLKESEIAKYKAQFLAMGYADELATETATAMVNGDNDKVFANQKLHLQNVESKIKADILSSTPKPVGDSGGKGMTLEAFRKLSPMERLEFANDNPTEYETLYTGGNE